MINIFIIFFAIILLGGLLYFERKGTKRSHLITKSILSLLFVVTAFLQPTLVPKYYHYLLAGLILCLIGDVCLALPGDKVFRMGLVAFLLGHVFYIFSFLSVITLSRWISPIALVIFAFSAGVFFWLRPYLQKMLVPVLVYILVITLMLCGAWVVFQKSSFPILATALIFAGAFCFYVSDIFVARDRFIK